MSVKVEMISATELLDTLPLNKTPLRSGHAAVLLAAPQQSELRPGEDLLARHSRLLLQLWTSLRQAVTLTCFKSRGVAFSEGGMVLK